MVTAAGYCVVYVRNKSTSLIIPSTKIIKECEVPEDALWIQCQGAVQLVVSQEDFLNCGIYFDKHHNCIDGSFVAASVEECNIKGGVPWWHNIIQGGQEDGSYKNVAHAGVGNVYDDAGVQVCHEVVVKCGSVEQDPLSCNGKLSIQVTGKSLH